MKLSVSNIAWGSAEDAAVYALLAQHGYAGIDIAPSRVWGKDHFPNKEEAHEFLKTLSSHHLKVGGMQSLLFGHPELTVFNDAEVREKTLEVLKQMVDTASLLGAAAVVFGSPKNRIMGGESEEKWKIAESFFGTLGDYAHTKGVAFSLEPNPAIYGGDFLTGTGETFAFAERVGSPGLKVNVDMGTVIENREDVEEFILVKRNLIGHVHVSLPGLAPVSIEETHRNVLNVLTRAGYEGWVTIEMLTPEGDERLSFIEQAVRELKDATRDSV